jgi:hypothetical protein
VVCLVFRRRYFAWALHTGTNRDVKLSPCAKWTLSPVPSQLPALVLSLYSNTENASVKVRTLGRSDWLSYVGLRDSGKVGGGEPRIRIIAKWSTTYCTKRELRSNGRGAEFCIDMRLQVWWRWVFGGMEVANGWGRSDGVGYTE